MVRILCLALLAFALPQAVADQCNGHRFVIIGEDHAEGSTIKDQIFMSGGMNLLNIGYEGYYPDKGGLGRGVQVRNRRSMNPIEDPMLSDAMTTYGFRAIQLAKMKPASALLARLANDPQDKLNQAAFAQSLQAWDRDPKHSASAATVRQALAQMKASSAPAPQKEAAFASALAGLPPGESDALLTEQHRATVAMLAQKDPNGKWQPLEQAYKGSVFARGTMPSKISDMREVKMAENAAGLAARSPGFENQIVFVGEDHVQGVADALAQRSIPPACIAKYTVTQGSRKFKQFTEDELDAMEIHSRTNASAGRTAGASR